MADSAVVLAGLDPPWVPATPDRVAATVWHSYCRARDNGHLRFIEEAMLFDEYYRGQQWEEAARRELDGQRRPYITVNLMLTTVNAVIGEYLGQQQDILYKARGQGAKEDTARALTSLVKHISDESKSKWVEKEVVMDGLIMDRGFFDIRLDTKHNMSGEILETCLNPGDVLLDPGANEYDPCTWAEVHFTRWMTPEQISQMYGPELGEKLYYVNPEDTFGYDAISFDPNTFSMDRNFYTNGPLIAPRYDGDWRRVHRCRVIEKQYYILTNRAYFVDQVTGDSSPIPEGWAPEKIAMVSQQYRLAIIQRPERRVRWTVIADKFLLKDDWSPYKRFTIIPFFPYFRRGRPFGMVRNLKSPQDLLNKTLSQELHVINTSANSGWMVEEGSLTNMSTQQLEDQGARTGLVIAYRRGTEPPEKINPNQIPTGLDRLATSAGGFFRDISGVSDAMLGTPGREISGEALARKEARGLVQLDTVFDNLALTRHLRAQHMLEIIQSYYTEPRILKITVTDDMGQKQDQDLLMNAQNAAGEIVNDLTVGDYSVVVSSRPASDSEDDSQLKQLLDMRQAGVSIPDWAIVERSNIEDRAEIAQWIRQTTGAAAPTPEEIQMQNMQQELQMRSLVANIEQIQATTQQRMAQAELFIAQAKSLDANAAADAQKFGAQLRLDLQQQMQDLQNSKNEILARLAIAQQKAQTTQYVASLGALAQRLSTESQERIAVTRGPTASSQIKAAQP